MYGRYTISSSANARVHSTIGSIANGKINRIKIYCTKYKENSLATSATRTKSSYAQLKPRRIPANIFFINNDTNFMSCEHVHPAQRAYCSFPACVQSNIEFYKNSWKHSFGVAIRFMCSANKMRTQRNRYKWKLFDFGRCRTMREVHRVVRGQWWAFIPWHIVKTKNTHSLALPDSLVAEMPFPFRIFFAREWPGAVDGRRSVCRFEYINCVCVNEYNEIRRQQRPILIRGKKRHERQCAWITVPTHRSNVNNRMRKRVHWVRCRGNSKRQKKAWAASIQSSSTSASVWPLSPFHSLSPHVSSPLRHRNDNEAERAWVREWRKKYFHEIGISRCATLHTVCTPCTILWKTALEWRQWLMTTEMVLANLGVGRNHFINNFFFRPFDYSFFGWECI